MTAISIMVITLHYLFIYLSVEDVDENVVDDQNNRSKDLQYMKSGRPISMLVNGAVYEAQNKSSPPRQ
jgi:hypothetical protein